MGLAQNQHPQPVFMVVVAIGEAAMRGNTTCELVSPFGGVGLSCIKYSVRDEAVLGH